VPVMFGDLSRMNSHVAQYYSLLASGRDAKAHMARRMSGSGDGSYLTGQSLLSRQEVQDTQVLKRT